MQIETIGQYQIHLTAHELSGTGGWAPFVEIEKFDERKQSFICIVEKRRAAAEPLPSYEEAIEAARRAGNALIAQAGVDLS